MVDNVVDEKLRKEFFKKSWTRIRGGFNSERHKLLVAEIRDDIEQLCNFTKGAINLEDIYCEQSSLAISRYWLGIQSHMHRLYNALYSVWSQSCSLHTHRAKLKLDVPKDDESYHETPQFNFSFLLGDNTTSMRSLPWKWRDVAVLSFYTHSPP